MFNEGKISKYALVIEELEGNKSKARSLIQTLVTCDDSNFELLT
jgi:hypothetical protein